MTGYIPCIVHLILDERIKRYHLVPLGYHSDDLEEAIGVAQTYGPTVCVVDWNGLRPMDQSVVWMSDDLTAAGVLKIMQPKG